MMEDVDKKPDKETATQTQLPAENQDATGLLDKMREGISEWQKVIAERKALLDREEKLLVERALGGRAMAGNTGVPTVDPQRQKEEEIKKKIFATMGR